MAEIDSKDSDPSPQPGDDRPDELFEQVYQELRRIASRQMSAQPDEHTLQPTALVNEAFLRLQGQASSTITDRAHLLRLGARVMRQILVDHARAKLADKRGGARPRQRIDLVLLEFERRSGGLLELDEALAMLADQDEQLARLVELRFFGGYDTDEIANLEGVAERTVRRRLELAKRLLKRWLER